jgi:hypothetical protein
LPVAFFLLTRRMGRGKKYANDANRAKYGRAYSPNIHNRPWLFRLVKRKDILTTGDVASICKCSHDTVKRWLEGEQLPGHRLTPHGQWRILPEDLLEFMERQGLPIDEEARSIFGLCELPIKDYVFCWEFHRRNKSHPALDGQECEDCLVYETKARDCFVLRKQAGGDRVLCRQPCEDCEYYRYITEIEIPPGAGKLPEA